MDKEDFYEMLVAFAKSVKTQESTDDCFSWHLDRLDFPEEMLNEFKEMIQG